MLKKLLSSKECANCKICCSFDSYDLWETPIITRNKASQILQEYKADQKFFDNKDYFLLKMEKEVDEDLYYCSLLDHKTGCIMGDEKPFDCTIWPFRIMDLNGTTVITVSPVCPVVYSRPIEDIMKSCAEISEEVFAKAVENPEYIKPYIEGYPIVAVEKTADKGNK